MKITRRQFLQGSAATTAAIGIGGKAQAMELALGNNSYNYIKRGEPRERVFTCSPLYAHENPVQAWVDDDPMAPENPLTHRVGRRVVEISGVTESNRSRGRVSAAEATAWMEVESGDRLLYPLKRIGKRGAGQWQMISWQQAHEQIAASIKASKANETFLMRGKDTSAGIWGRFMQTLGSNSLVELDDAINQRSAWQTAWGDDVSVPDLAHSHYILNFGTNFLVSRPDYAAEAMDGKMLRRAKIVTFDPRCSKTAGLSDEWIPVRPGTDGVVALAMAHYLLQQGRADTAAIERFSNLTATGLLQELTPYTLEHAAEISGVPALTLRDIARRFSESSRACIITGSGISRHANAFDTERALMLLPLVTGNLEVKGGNCRPRRIELGDIEPKPASPPTKNPVKNAHRFPWDAGTQYPVKVLFGYNTNPGFNAPAAAAWRNTLADEAKVEFFVAIGTFRNETWELADLILPEAHWLERNEPVQGSGSLLPWVGLRQQVVEPPGEAMELREILRDIVQAGEDPAQSRYWQFQDSREWLGTQLNGIAGLQQDGGWELMAKHSGVWPIYGYLHPEVRRIVNEQGEEILPEYGLPVKMTQAPFPHWQAAKDTVISEGELTLLVHAADYHAGDASANDKVIMEITLANHLHINAKTAESLQIADGDLVRVTSKSGYLVTHAHLTQTIHPEVVAMHREGGHWSIGGIASGKAGPKHKDSPANIDADVARNLWWSDMGVHPLDIILPVFDEQGGGSASATSVTVKHAEDGDIYGKVEVDISALLAFNLD
ncbi:hypothetical protein MNBD_GAMMA20-2372 [hydrothermal vent metagenome]|uniref:Anaerobic dehydrogenases, typically selenocysteine-containing n=1 Tax=hydrothermal vent metagenome TaxID=652676 RepID=A0A3B1ARY8_9ZZZZ